MGARVTYFFAAEAPGVALFINFLIFMLKGKSVPRSGANLLHFIMLLHFIATVLKI